MTREKIIETLSMSIDDQRRPFESKALREVIELLKAEAPRVMTFEELRHAEVFWIERKGLYGCYAALSGTFGNTYFPYVIGADLNDRNDGARRYIVRIADYGKTWRCWSRSPTEEQMEATQWPTE